VFSFIGIVFFKVLISLIRCFKVVISKEDSTLLIIVNNVFYFINLCKEDVSVVCNFKR